MYDEADEDAEALYAALLTVLRRAPDRLGKKMLASLFEDRALCEALLEAGGGSFPSGEAKEEALGAVWERVCLLREARA